jgi:hypothetical protein
MLVRRNPQVFVRHHSEAIPFERQAMPTAAPRPLMRYVCDLVAAWGVTNATEGTRRSTQLVLHVVNTRLKVFPL